MKPVISVVIPVLNGAATIGEQLAALASATPPPVPFEVLIADNGSTDGTAEVALSYTGELMIRIIDAGAKRGINYARNRGTAAAQGQFVLLCDSDDVVDPTWIVEMYAGFQGGADVVAGRIDYRLLNPQRVWQWRGTSGSGLDSLLGFLPFGHGACLGFTRSVFDTIGGFDETYVGGGDDVDFCWRAQLAGAHIQEVPDAVVHYRLRSSLRGLAKQEVAYGAAEALLFRRFSTGGLRRRGLGELGHELWWLMSRAPLALPMDRRGAWIRKAARQFGRFKGALNHRVWWW